MSFFARAGWAALLLTTSAMPLAADTLVAALVSAGTANDENRKDFGAAARTCTIAWAGMTSIAACPVANRWMWTGALTTATSLEKHLASVIFRRSEITFCQ